MAEWDATDSLRNRSVARKINGQDFDTQKTMVRREVYMMKMVVLGPRGVGSLIGGEELVRLQSTTLFIPRGGITRSGAEVADSSAPCLGRSTRVRQGALEGAKDGSLANGKPSGKCCVSCGLGLSSRWMANIVGEKATSEHWQAVWHK